MVEAPTIIWLSEKPTVAYWQWVPSTSAPLVMLITALAPGPCIAVAPAAVAQFKYSAVLQTCPQYKYKGPLYYSLSTVGTLLAELHPGLREHHGDLALLVPHGLSTEPPPRPWP